MEIEETTSFSQRLGELLAGSEEVLVTTHHNPDGDAIGSVIAFSKFLDLYGIGNTMLIPNKYPDYLGFLDQDRKIIFFENNTKRALKAIDRADVILCLDFNTLARTEEMREPLSSSKAYKILIDHHPQPVESEFDLVISDTSKSSTAELVFDLLMKSEKISGDVMNLPMECADALWTGMITDTNNFANSISSETFLMAGKMIERGVNVDQIRESLFGQYSYDRIRLLGELLTNKMVIFEDLKAGVIILTLEDQERFNFQTGDSEGFVNIPITIKGINISAFFTERKDKIRVSLRSRGDFSVNQFSREYFNGGGHTRAAGGDLNIPVGEVVDYFRDSLIKFLKK